MVLLNIELNNCITDTHVLLYYMFKSVFSKLRSTQTGRNFDNTTNFGFSRCRIASALCGPLNLLTCDNAVFFTAKILLYLPQSRIAPPSPNQKELPTAL